MTTVRKFTFDLDFDVPEAPKSVVEEVAEEEPEQEEEIPTFSEDDLAVARAEGHEAGREEGRKEAADATEQRLLEAIEVACDGLAKVFNEQAEANRDIARDTIGIATTITKKLFPDLNARNALGEVERVVQETLNAITEEPRVQIMVHPDLREPFTERLATMTNRAGFDGKVFINPDPSMTLGDCRVEWSNGAAVRDTDVLWEMIDEIVERNLHGPMGAGDDADATENPAPESATESPDAEVPADGAASAPHGDENTPNADTEASDQPPAQPPLETPPVADAEHMDDSAIDENIVPDQALNNEGTTASLPAGGDDDATPSADDGDDGGNNERFTPVITGDAVSPETTAAILAAQADDEDETGPSGQ